MTLDIFLAFWSVSFLLVITLGVDWAYTISAGINGKAIVLPAVIGLLGGHLIVTALVAIGVGAIITSNPLIFMILTVLGAAYLLWIGFTLLITPATPIQVGNSSTISWSKWTLKGVCVSGLNPKVFLLFLALLPQFTNPTAHLPVPMQVMALGLVHILSCGIVYLIVGFSSQAVLQTRPSIAQVINRISGFLMIIIASCLSIEQLNLR